MILRCFIKMISIFSHAHKRILHIVGNLYNQREKIHFILKEWIESTFMCEWIERTSCVEAPDSLS